MQGPRQQPLLVEKSKSDTCFLVRVSKNISRKSLDFAEKEMLEGSENSLNTVTKSLS